MPNVTVVREIGGIFIETANMKIIELTPKQAWKVSEALLRASGDGVESFRQEVPLE